MPQTVSDEDPSAFEALFASLARLRGRNRVFHPVGDAYEGVLRIDGDPVLDGAPLLTHHDEHRVIIRLSRGAGLPDGLPDVLGLAIKLPDAHGPGRDQDFLLATSGSGPPLYHLLLPATSFFARPFSSILPYRVADRLCLFGVLPDSTPRPGVRGLEEVATVVAEGVVTYRFAVAALFRPWRVMGELRLGDPVAPPVAEQLRFDPWHCGGGVRPWGPPNLIRRPAYRGSRRGRGAPR